MKSFYQPRSHPEAWSVNAHCLDEPVALAIELFDGRDWEARKAALDGDSTPLAIAAAMTHHALRLRLDSAALVANWRWLQRVSRGRGGGGGQGRRLWAWRARGGGAARRGRVPRLLRLDLGRGRGARARCPRARALSVLHGVGPDDLDAALASDGAAGAQHAGAGRAVEADRRRAGRAT